MSVFGNHSTYLAHANALLSLDVKEQLTPKIIDLCIAPSVGCLRSRWDDELLETWIVPKRIKHFTLLVNQQLRVTYDVDERHVFDLEFYICGMVGRHLTRAHLYVRQ